MTGRVWRSSLSSRHHVHVFHPDNLSQTLDERERLIHSERDHAPMDTLPLTLPLQLSLSPYYSWRPECCLSPCTLLETDLALNNGSRIMQSGPKKQDEMKRSSWGSSTWELSPPQKAIIQSPEQPRSFDRICFLVSEDNNELGWTSNWWDGWSLPFTLSSELTSHSLLYHCTSLPLYKSSTRRSTYLFLSISLCMHNLRHSLSYKSSTN